jgi:rSAM/selenodomain-associated transferase 1
LNHLVIFAKAPRPGLVKTRLAQTLGVDQACRAYQHLLHALASRLGSLISVTVYHSPPDAEPDLRCYFPSHWQFRHQHGPDLGTRLQNAIAITLETDATKVTVIGSDCPYLTVEDIQQSWTRLDHHDLVLGPANDGGYWLIALKQPQPHLFHQINWGTNNVLAQTIVRARDLNLKVALLRELSDIDTEADWRAFAAQSAVNLQ